MARDAGVDVVVTSLLDSVVGRSAALHLAAALPEGPAAGLATGDLLTDDLADAPAPAAGRLALPTGAGLGVRPGKLARLATAATVEVGA